MGLANGRGGISTRVTAAVAFSTPPAGAPTPPAGSVRSRWCQRNRASPTERAGASAGASRTASERRRGYPRTAQAPSTCARIARSSALVESRTSAAQRAEPRRFTWHISRGSPVRPPRIRRCGAVPGRGARTCRARRPARQTCSAGQAAPRARRSPTNCRPRHRTPREPSVDVGSPPTSRLRRFAGDAPGKLSHPCAAHPPGPVARARETGRVRRAFHLTSEVSFSGPPAALARQRLSLSTAPRPIAPDMGPKAWPPDRDATTRLPRAQATPRSPLGHHSRRAGPAATSQTTWELTCRAPTERIPTKCRPRSRPVAIPPAMPTRASASPPPRVISPAPFNRQPGGARVAEPGNHPLPAAYRSHSRCSPIQR
jgi:hypothetical protein